jgi:N-acetylneuraminic acid mutarotase
MNRKSIFVIALNIAALLLVGGFSTSTQQPIMAATLSDFTQIQWTKLPDSAQYWRGASEAQSVVVNQKLYVFGGYAPCCTPTRRAYVFDPTTETWTRLADMPKGLTHGGFTTDGTDIYYAGGYPENASQTGQQYGTRDVYRYNIASNDYTPLPLLPKKNSTGQLTYLNGKLHYIAGTTRNWSTPIIDLDDHYIFDLEAFKTNPNTAWVDITQYAPLPNPRQHAAIAVVDGMIYYIGGQKGHDGPLEPQNDVHRYNPNVGEWGTWTQLADLPDPLGRNHMGNSTIVVDGRIIVMAGQTHGYKATPQNTVFAYDIQKNSWTSLTSLPNPQHSGIGAFLNGAIYFGLGSYDNGGNDRRAMYKGVPVLIDATSTPVPATNTSVPPTATTAGETSTPTATSDVSVTETPSGQTTATATDAAGTTETPNATETASTGSTQTPNATATNSTGATETPSGQATATATSSGATSTPDVNETAAPTNTTQPQATSTPQTGTELLTNGGFELDVAPADKMPDAWKGKRLTKDKMVCNKLNRPGLPDKIVAHDGNCAFQFKGGIGEKSQIAQTLPAGTYAANTPLTLSAYVSAKEGVKGKLQAVVAYTGSLPKTKIVIDFAASNDYQLVSKSEQFLDANVAKIKVQVKHTSTSGKVRVDDVSLLITDSVQGLVPLP